MNCNTKFISVHNLAYKKGEHINKITQNVRKKRLKKIEVRINNKILKYTLSSMDRNTKFISVHNLA